MRKQRKDWGTDLNKSLFPLEKKKKTKTSKSFCLFLLLAGGKYILQLFICWQ